jgi:serine/threonine protein kinase/tetratricopeptide (TPR) repeat protein
MSQCPSGTQLKRLLDDDLDSADSDPIGFHLEGCAACRERLDRIIEQGRSSVRAEAAGCANPVARDLLERLKAMGPLLDTGNAATAGSTEGEPPAQEVEAPHCRSTDISATDGPRSRQPLPAFDGFRIVREIGRGGMGVVYEAEEERLSRRVALKVLPTSLLTQEKQIQRFEREARAAARLHHTNIVPVFGVGEENGHHYYFMQFIEGKTLAASLDEQKDPQANRSGSTRVDRLLRVNSPEADRYRRLGKIGVEVAEALDHAHSQGILHRDIKPSNLIQDNNGNVWVADFGLAKALDDHELTTAGELLGTIRYMAPERFGGNCDARSDLYALGITLYELAALGPAHVALDRYQLIDEMRHKDPAALGKRVPGIPRDLETIIHKAIAREPARRYASASDLADDLRRFLDDRPILARLPSPAERVIRWCKRNRWASAFLVALVFGVIASVWQAIRATAAERIARIAETTARSERDRAQRARDRAMVAVRELLLLQNGHEAAMQSEEMRSSRKTLIDAGVRESRALVQELEGDPQAGLQLVGAYHSLSRIELEAGERPRAIESARRAVAVAESVHERDKTAETARSLGAALQQLSAALPDPVANELAAKRSNAILEAALTMIPSGNDEEWKRMIAANHINMGQRNSDQGRFAEAIDHLQAARALCQSMLEHSGPNQVRIGALARVWLSACRAYRQSGRFDESIDAAREAAALYRGLLADHPGEFEFEYGHALQLAYQEMAFAYLDSGKAGEAISGFNEARKALKLMVATPGCLVSRVVQLKSDLAVVDYNMKVATDTDTVRFAAPRREVIYESKEICDKLGFVQPLSFELRRILAAGCLSVAIYQEQDGGQPDITLLRKSEQLWEETRRLAPASLEARGFLVIARRELMQALAARGEHHEASRWQELSLTTARGDANLLFEIALEYARRIGPIDHLATTLDAPRRAALRQRVVDDTIAMLREAVADDFNDAVRLRGEMALVPIRGDAAFQAISSSMALPRDVFAPALSRQ